MKKKLLWSVCYGTVLTAFTVYMALDTFVISRSYRSDATQMNTSMFDSSDNTDSLDLEENPDSSASGSDDSSSNGSGSGSDDSSSNGSGSDSDGSQSSHSHSGRKGHGQRPSWDESSDKSSTGGSSSDGSSSGNSSSSGSSTSGTSSSESSTSGSSTNEASTGESQTYEDDDTKITLTEYYENNTKIYVADIQLESAEQLKTAFANDSYGKNVTAKTSEIAESNNAILAINGDYYGTQESGYVIRNGIAYRDTDNGNDILCVYADGTLKVYESGEKTVEELVAEGVWQAFSFGPGLLEDGEVTVSEGEEVGKSMASNPRTAIGMIDKNHYVFVVADGRTSESEGLSLYEMAQFLSSLGVKTAYNLDGGGSSTMYFNGEIINNPTTTGHNIKEREVSDIVYIAKN